MGVAGEFLRPSARAKVCALGSFWSNTRARGDGIPTISSPSRISSPLRRHLPEAGYFAWLRTNAESCQQYEKGPA